MMREVRTPKRGRIGISLRKMLSINGEDILLKDIISCLGDKGFFFLFIIFALPSALPVPAFGYTTILCLPIIIFAIQEIQGRDVANVPNFIGKRKLSKKILRRAIIYIFKIEKRLFFILRPRLLMFSSHYAKKILAFLCLILAIFACIPLPLTNTIPCLSIGIISISVLYRDGLVILSGVIMGIAGMFLACIAYLYGLEKIKAWLL